MPEFREDLLRNAVAFLKHPSVVGTPLARRVAFMKGKGLTSAEIEEALTRAGAAATATSAPLPQPTNVQYVPQPPMQPPPSGMSWSGLALTAILAAGAGVAATYLVKNYVIPWWKGPSEPELPAEAAPEATKDKDERDNLEQLSKAVSEQQEAVQKVIEECKSIVSWQGSKNLATEISALRSEVQSLKYHAISAVHSSDTESTQSKPAQFTPPSKFISTSSIPAWQQPRPAVAESSPNSESPAVSAPVTQPAGTFGGAPIPPALKEVLENASSFTDIKQVDDSPIPDAVIEKGTKQPAPKPWERKAQQPQGV